MFLKVLTRLYRFVQVCTTSNNVYNIVQYYVKGCNSVPIRATCFKFVQSQNNLHSFVRQCTILFSFLRDWTSCEQVAQIGTELQPFDFGWTSPFSKFIKTFVKNCTILCRCGCRHFENLKSLRYGMISLSHGQCALTIILHSAVKFAAVKWTLLTASFVKQMATLYFGKKFVVRTVKALLPRFLKPIRKAMLPHRQMMGTYGLLRSAKLSIGSVMLNWQAYFPVSPVPSLHCASHMSGD